MLRLAAILLTVGTGGSAQEPTVWPISGLPDKPDYPIIAPWGPRGMGGYDFHRGIDFTASVGTPIHAVRAGKIVMINEWEDKNSTAGKYVIIEHAKSPDGTPVQTANLHMNKIYVKVGQQVKMGEVIGEAGITGKGNPVSHLHFEYHQGSFGAQTDSRNPLMLFQYPKTNAYKLTAKRTGEGVEVYVGHPAGEIDIDAVILVPERGAPIAMDFIERGSSRAETAEFNGVRVIPKDYPVWGKLWAFICVYKGAPAGVKYRVQVKNCKGDQLVSPWVDIGGTDVDLPLQDFGPAVDLALKTMDAAKAAEEKGKPAEALRLYDRIVKTPGIAGVKAQAEAAVARIQKQTDGQAADAERLAGEGKAAEAVAILRKLAQEYRGTRAGMEADKRARAIAAETRIADAEAAPRPGRAARVEHPVPAAGPLAILPPSAWMAPEDQLLAYADEAAGAGRAAEARQLLETLQVTAEDPGVREQAGKKLAELPK